MCPAQSPPDCRPRGRVSKPANLSWNAEQHQLALALLAKLSCRSNCSAGEPLNAVWQDKASRREVSASAWTSAATTAAWFLWHWPQSENRVEPPYDGDQKPSIFWNRNDHSEHPRRDHCNGCSDAQSTDWILRRDLMTCARRKRLRRRSGTATSVAKGRHPCRSTVLDIFFV